MTLLREHGFRIFWLANSVSLLGDQITLLALPLVAVLVLDAGAGQMGLLAAAALLPHLLFPLCAPKSRRFEPGEEPGLRFIGGNPILRPTLTNG